MDLIDLEDYEFHAAITSVLNSRVVSPLDFSPLIIFLIDWARENKFIQKAHFEETIGEDNYEKLRLGKITFNEFVLEKMDGKLSSKMFEDNVREFVEEYVEFDGYVKDLTDVFMTNIGDLPSDFEKIDLLHRKISDSRDYYLRNKINFPDLVSFTEPEQFKKEMSGV